MDGILMMWGNQVRWFPVPYVLDIQKKKKKSGSLQLVSEHLVLILGFNDNGIVVMILNGIIGWFEPDSKLGLTQPLHEEGGSSLQYDCMKQIPW